MKLEIITEVAALNKAIDAWGKTGKKWAEAGHALAMSALTHLDKHGDIGPVNRLFLAMPKGTKSSAMAVWFLTFGKLAPGADKTQPFVYAKDAKNDLEGAAKKPWFEFKPEPTVVELFDAHAALLKAIATIKTGASKAQTAKGLETIAKVEELIAELAPAGEGDPLAE